MLYNKSELTIKPPSTKRYCDFVFPLVYPISFWHVLQLAKLHNDMAIYEYRLILHKHHKQHIYQTFYDFMMRIKI